MSQKANKLGFVVLFIFTIFSLHTVYAVDATFINAGTQVVNLRISSNQLADIDFTITGLSQSGSFPTNVSIDIGDDGSIEWEYKVYHTNIPITLNSISSAWSTNPSDDNTYFSNMRENVEIFDLEGLGRINNNVFHFLDSFSNSKLGITSMDPLNDQILSIKTNNQFVHAFIPAITPIEGTAGLYVAQGGSTYYCNSDHTFSFTSECNLSPTQAMVPAHLARQADQHIFNGEEILKDENILSAINSRLSSCSSFPCNIPVKITSESAGTLRLEHNATSFSSPAEISLVDSGSSYSVSITPNAALTQTKYFYGTMPNVYVIPVVAGNDNLVFSQNQKNRLTILNNTLASSWDKLTDNSHPLNITFYLTPQLLTNYRPFQDYSRFQYEISTQLIPSLNIQGPAVIIILDIRDYFPNKDPSNSKYQSGSIISQIYVNGFADTPKTFLNRYNEEILPNIVLHEIMHSFIEYPSIPSEKKFYSNHPASFTDNPDFSTYSRSQSYNSQEGYFEIYSIMNQLRVYMTKSQIDNRDIELSPLDKMLLGILSPKVNSAYTYYSGSIVKQVDRYTSSGISPDTVFNANNIYYLSNDLNWWDVRKSSDITQGTLTSFSIPKSEQQNRAIWVFANDASNIDNFKVFNLNARSMQTSIGSIISPGIDVGSGDGGSDDDNGGGGGGGGGNDSPDNSLLLEQYASWRDIISFEDQELSAYSPIQLHVRSKDRIFLKFNDRKYYLSIFNVGNGIVSFDFMTGDATGTEIGTSRSFDLNEDGNADVKVTLDNIIGEESLITVESLSSSINTGDDISSNNSQPNSSTSLGLIFWFTSSCLLFVITAYIYYRLYIKKNANKINSSISIQ